MLIGDSTPLFVVQVNMTSWRFSSRALALVALLLPASALAETPSEGVPQELRAGLYTDMNLGAFMTYGGKDTAGAAGMSNPQLYLQLGIGYEFTRNWGVSLTVGQGSSTPSCFGIVLPDGKCVSEEKQDEVLSESFVLTMVTAGVNYRHYFNDRLALVPHLDFGWAGMEPAPVTDGGKPLTSALIGGVGVGIEYATHMDHFTIGADLAGRMVIGTDIITLAVYPKVKYIF